ncbi:hypothetical protein QTP70_026038, partial [Hemibagrus guttatus]
MDQLSEEVRQESPWTMMFADDIVICSESREQVEENLERWRFALERRGMKVSRSKTEYMCVNEREGSGTVRLQGEEVKNVQEFKYLGSTVQTNGECGKEARLTYLPTPVSGSHRSLTGRKQYVKLGLHLAASMTISTGVPQSCVLSSFLYSLYISDYTTTQRSIKIMKFADDTIVVRLISNNDETIYRSK